MILGDPLVMYFLCSGNKLQETSELVLVQQYYCYFSGNFVASVYLLSHFSSSTYNVHDPEPFCMLLSKANTLPCSVSRSLSPSPL